MPSVDLSTTGEASPPTTKRSRSPAGTGTVSNLRRTFGCLWRDFKDCYSDSYLIKWSIWWAFATCGNFQIGNYIQPLWQQIAPSDVEKRRYNGLTEAASTLLGALSAFGVGFLKVNWEILGEGTLSFISIVDGILLVVMSQTDYLVVAYVFYVLFRASYQLMITVASYEVARNLADDSYGLVFGFNTFVSLVLQTILTLVVVDPLVGLELPPREQFVVYGSYFVILGILFFVMGIHSIRKVGCRNIRKKGIWLEERKDTEREERNSEEIDVG